MGRPRLDPEERERRRKARVAHSFSDAAYTHYDTSKGYGSIDEWIRAVEALFEGRGVIRDMHGLTQEQRDDLDALCLDDMPATYESLRMAFRNVMKIHHPDKGGSEEMAKKCILAFEKLRKLYQ